MSDKEIAAKLRALANEYDSGRPVQLTLNQLGDIFGNEFWNLLKITDNTELTVQVKRIADTIQKWVL